MMTITFLPFLLPSIYIFELYSFRFLGLKFGGLTFFGRPGGELVTNGRAEILDETYRQSLAHEIELVILIW